MNYPKMRCLTINEKWIDHSGVVLSNIGDLEELVFITQNGCSNTRMVVLEKWCPTGRKWFWTNQNMAHGSIYGVIYSNICLELWCRHKGVSLCCNSSSQPTGGERTSMLSRTLIWHVSTCICGLVVVLNAAYGHLERHKSAHSETLY